MTTPESQEIAIVRNLYAAFVEHDMQTMFADVHDDIVYVLHVDPDIIPMGGEHRGKTEFRAVVDGMNESFSYLRFNRSRFRQSGDIVVLRVDYTCLHKATGEIISGAYTSEVTVRDGRVVRLEEFPDAGLLEALFRFSAANVPAARPG